MGAAVQIMGIIALVLVALAAAVLLVVGAREAPSIIRYLRIRRM